MEIKNLSTNQLNQNGYSKNTLTKGKIGALFTFPTLYTPDDCLSCEGYSLKISDYKDLYRVLGTQFNKTDDEIVEDIAAYVIMDIEAYEKSQNKVGNK